MSVTGRECVTRVLADRLVCEKILEKVEDKFSAFMDLKKKRMAEFI